MTYHDKKNYPPESAGQKMTTKIPLASPEETLFEVEKRLREKKAQFETINYIYVIDENKILAGIISIKDIFRWPKEKKVKEIMKTRLVTVSPFIDQEKVANLALAHNLKAIPVVEKGQLLGVVPSDKILSILNREFREDVLYFSGIHKAHLEYEDTLSVPIFQGVKHRLPWLIIGLFGGIGAAQIMGFFEKVISQNLILAFFTPLIVYLSDAVGTQIQTLFVRDLAIRNHKFSLKLYTFKQFLITIFVSLLCSILFFIIASLIWQDFYLSLVVGIAMFLTLISAVLIAILIPFLLFKFGSDPAFGSGPLATILQDILSVIIYFSTASLML